MKKILFFTIFFTLGLGVSGQTERTITTSPLLAGKKDTIGVTFLGDETPVLVGETADDIDKIRSIKWKDKGYEMTVVNPKPNVFRLNGVQVDYHGGVGLSQVGRLPDLGVPNDAGFFRTAVSFQNSVNSKFRFERANIVELVFGQNRSNNPVPYSHQDVYNVTLKADRWSWNNFTADVGVSGSSSGSRLTNFGASHARLFNAVLNGNSDQYPYRELPDKNDTKELLAWLKTKYGNGDFETEASLSFNKQWDERKMGMIEPVSPPFLRDEQLSELHAGLSAKYDLFRDRYYWFSRHNRLDIMANYSFNRNANVVSRMNSQVFDGFRNEHELLYGVSYKYLGHVYLFIDLKNKHYFSNTANNYRNFFPSASLDFYFDQFLNNLVYDFNFRNFKLFGSAGRSLGEAMLVYRNYSALTTEMSAATALSSFYEDREILSPTKTMTSEIYENYEAGFKTEFWFNGSSLMFTYFNNTTRNMIAPHSSAGQFFLQNIGDVRNDGFLVRVSFVKNNNHSRSEFSVKFNFSKMKSKVLNVSDGHGSVALAGFSDVGTYFAEGEPLGPLGVIFGTTYQRTDAGDIVVDSNGFPLIDTELKRIGDPTPNFTMGLAPKLKWVNFEFSFAMDYNNGGDRWNGTKAFLEKSTAIKLRCKKL